MPLMPKLGTKGKQICIFVTFSVKEKVSRDATDEVLMSNARPSPDPLRGPPSPIRERDKLTSI